MTSAAELPGSIPYRGRFAPTPSGPLHLGSVIAALGSYLQARTRNGTWTIRIEDLDQQRNRPGAADSILADLERLGFVWEEPPVYQSQRHEHYTEALQRLQSAGLVFDCGCSRRETSAIYPGTCRHGLPPGRQARSLRLRIPERVIQFIDRVQGKQSVNLQKQIGDFVLRRADNVIAYHLAVVIDDAAGGMTEIVRGADLLESTAPQLLLQELLDLPTPDYLHLPIAYDRYGQKISKQNHCAAIAAQSPATVLCQALAFLGHAPEKDFAKASAAEVLDWAISHWQPENIPTVNLQRF